VYHDLVDMYLAIDAQRLLDLARRGRLPDQGVFPRVLEATLSKLNGSQMAPQIALTAVKLSWAATESPRSSRFQTALRDSVTALVAGGAPRRF